jgi:lysophospholipase L1-like esterase
VPAIARHTSALIAILLVSWGASAHGAWAAGKPARYLALGDSVTFGFEEAQVRPPPDYQDAASFHAYPEFVGDALGLRTTNAGCPGETTASFIDPNAPSNGCENLGPGTSGGYRTAFPLHVSYEGSQLSFGVKFLKAHPRTRLVSLMIGANDLFRRVPLATVTDNVHHILAAIRKKAKYHGRIVLLSYYSLGYANPGISETIQGLNAAVDAGAKGLRITRADGFGEFGAASEHSGGSACAAGLLTQLSGGGCGVHPSYAGQSLLALAVERAL